jgi:omega-6 fatty acid desaturase (delta-12 desaturase)
MGLHLNSRNPNHQRQEYLDGHEKLEQVGRLTLRDSLRSLGLAFWDEDACELVGLSRLSTASAFLRTARPNDPRWSPV